MTRTLQPLAITAALLLCLSGCAMVPLGPAESSDEPAVTSAPTTTEPSESPTEEPIDEETPEPAPTAGDSTTMTFEDGATLSADAAPQWSDALLLDDNWAYSKPDDGNGGWGYSTVDGACTADFWQGKVFDMTATNDLDATAFILGFILERDPANALEVAATVTTGNLSAGNQTTEMLATSGGSEGVTGFLAVRGFAQSKAALRLAVTCNNPDAAAVGQSILASSAIVTGLPG